MTRQPLHTLYLDRPLKGALLMQTLARVNRTFRGKEDGLLVSYAPLVDNLGKALAEYSPTDQATKPMGRDIDEAVGCGRAIWLSWVLSQRDTTGAPVEGRPQAGVAASGTGAHGIPPQSGDAGQPGGGGE
jgi:type I restriction enzyme R subunit